MNGTKKLGSESDFVIGGCLHNDCDSCPSNENNTCPDFFLGGGVKSNKVVDDSGKEIKKILLNRGDTL